MSLSIAVRFAEGSASDQTGPDGQPPAWPPDAADLLAALTECWIQRGRDPDKQPALDWLAQQPAPLLTGQAVVFRHPPASRNAQPPPQTTPADSSGEAEAQQSPQGQDHATILYQWPDAEPSPLVKLGLVALLRSLSQLGRPPCPARAWIVDAPAVPAPATKPRDTSGSASSSNLRAAQVQHSQAVASRSPSSDPPLATIRRDSVRRRTSNRDSNARRFPPPIQGNPPVLDMTRYLAWQSDPPRAPSGVFDRLLVFRRVDAESSPEPAAHRPQLTLADTCEVMKAWRNAVFKHCAIQPTPEWVGGHREDGTKTNEPHLATVPLAVVGRPGAEGQLLGVGLAVPKNHRGQPLTDALLSQALAPLLFGPDDAPPAIPIWSNHRFRWQVQLVRGPRHPTAVVAATWIAAAQHWASVTPVVLDRHPKQPGDAERSVGLACERLGLPAPRRIVLEPTSPLTGVPDALRFPHLPSKPGQPNRLQFHVTLELEEPVYGPILLGAGRFRGYGWFHPLSPAGVEPPADEIG